MSWCLSLKLLAHVCTVASAAGRATCQARRWGHFRTGQVIVDPCRCDSSRQGRVVRHKVKVLTRRHVAAMYALPCRYIVRPLVCLERAPLVYRW